MSKEITEIINTLCEKLGVAASVLVPELAKYNIARLAVAAVLGILITAVIIVLLYKYYRYKKENDEVEEWLVISLIPGVVALVFGIATCVIIVDLVGWIVSPTASAVMEITNMIK